MEKNEEIWIRGVGGGDVCACECVSVWVGVDEKYVREGVCVSVCKCVSLWEYEWMYERVWMCEFVSVRVWLSVHEFVNMWVHKYYL